MVPCENVGTRGFIMNENQVNFAQMLSRQFNSWEEIYECIANSTDMKSITSFSGWYLTCCGGDIDDMYFTSNHPLSDDEGDIVTSAMFLKSRNYEEELYQYSNSSNIADFKDLIGESIKVLIEREYCQKKEIMANRFDVKKINGLFEIDGNGHSLSGVCIWGDLYYNNIKKYNTWFSLDDLKQHIKKYNGSL